METSLQGYETDWVGYDYRDSDSEFRTCDLDLGPGMNGLLLAGWLVICFIGFAVMFVADKKFIGAGIIALPTFIGMVIKPSFALCIFLLVLPSGTAIAVEESFTLNKGIGLAMAAAFALNCLLSRPRLRVSKRVVWFAFGYFVCIFLSLLVTTPKAYVLRDTVSRSQYFGLLLIVYWILSNNNEKSLIWSLRCFVLGAIGTVGISLFTGVAVRAVEDSPEARFTATAAGTINANVFSAIVALAMLAVVYLLLKERKLLWKAAYLAALPILLVIMFKAGSRGTLLAVFGALVLGFFGKQLLSNGKLILAVAAVLFLFVAGGFVILRMGLVEESVADRLTDVWRYKEAFAYRMELNKTAIENAMNNPIGTGQYQWFMKTGLRNYPHNDLLFSLGLFGLPAALFYIAIWASAIIYVMRMPDTAEKLYARLIVIFLLMIGLKGMYVFQKFYWIFIAVVLVCGEISRALQEQQMPENYDWPDETTENMGYYEEEQQR